MNNEAISSPAYQKIHSASLCSQKKGEGAATIVFLHGLSGSKEYWYHGIDHHLDDDRFTKVYVDLSGFGESDKPSSKLSPAHHVECLKQHLAEYTNFVLVGHSLGAMLALAYAAENPEKVSKLILNSMPYFNFDEEHSAKNYFSKMPWPYNWILTNKFLSCLCCAAGRRALSGMLKSKKLSGRMQFPKPVMKGGLNHTWRTYTSSMWECIYGHNPTQTFQQLLKNEVPVDIIHGDDDSVAPPAYLQSFMQQFDQSNINIQYLQGDHHLLYGESREAFIDFLLLAAKNKED